MCKHTLWLDLRLITNLLNINIMKIIKSKFVLIAICSFFIFQNCNEKTKSDELTSEQIESIKNSEEFKTLSSSEKELVSMDLQSAEDKEKSINQKSVDDVWYNTKCRTDGRVCCRNCTSNGDPNRCAKTRFRSCSVCGHGKSSHYAQRR